MTYYTFDKKNEKVCVQNTGGLCIKILAVFTSVQWLHILFAFVYFLKHDYFWNKKE